MARPINLNGGRPSKFDARLVATLLERVSNGEPLTIVAKELGVVAGTVLGWADRRPWLKAALEQAQKLQARHLHEEQLPIADATVGAPNVAAIYSAQLRCNVRRTIAKTLDPETYGERVQPAAGGGATVHIYLPGKPQPSVDSARVIEGSAKRLEDGSDEPGTDN